MVRCGACGHGNRDGAKFCEECATALAPHEPPPEIRKTVTVLFCDLTGSTALGETLDPEPLRALLARYFERMKAIVERHGGSVEKFIGDAVMAVFGVPVLHEDDALRAVRAAVEMRDALPELGLQGTDRRHDGRGGDGDGRAARDGDAVNVAARLEQAAQPGEVLIGEPTLALVRDAAEVEPVEPLELKGKAEPVPAYRLLRVRDAPERRHGALFVGRERELALAPGRVGARAGRAALRAGHGRRRCRRRQVSARRGAAGVDRGDGRPRPLPPLRRGDHLLAGRRGAEAARPAASGRGRRGGDPLAARRERGGDLRGGDRLGLPQDPGARCGGAAAGGRVRRHPVGRGDVPRPDRARRAPLLGRIDPAALHGAAGAQRAPPRLAGDAPARAPARRRRRRAHPGARSPESCARGSLARRAATRSSSRRCWRWPARPTARWSSRPRCRRCSRRAWISSSTAERSVLERGAIEGEIFHRGAVQALAPEETQVTPRLAALVRKELIRPDTPQLAGEDGFRFRHLLIRDAAYDALPKATRADLHERFASWLEQHGTELVELDEILGYHLEQACRYRAELGLAADDELAAAARRRLTAAGHRADLRQDYGAAVSLLERAAALVPPTEIDLALETELGDALLWTGRADDALRRADALAERASAAGDRVGELCGRIQAGVVGLYLETGGRDGEAGRARRAGAARVRGRRRRPGSVHRLRRARGGGVRARADGRSAGGLRAGLRPRSAGRPPSRRGRWGRSPRVASSARLPCRNCSRGSTRTSHEQGGITSSVPTGPGRWRCSVASTRRARSSPRRARSWPSAAGESCSRTSPPSSPSGSSSGPAIPPPPPSSEQRGAGCTRSWGRELSLSAAAGSLAQALYALDRLDEADAWAGRAAELGASDDVDSRCSGGRSGRRCCARRGEHAEAERLAREAVAIGDGTEMLDAQGDAYADLAEVLLLAGRRTKRPPRSSRRSSATSARATSSWPHGRVSGSRRCGGERPSCRSSAKAMFRHPEAEGATTFDQMRTDSSPLE